MSEERILDESLHGCILCSGEDIRAIGQMVMPSGWRVVYAVCDDCCEGLEKENETKLKGLALRIEEKIQNNEVLRLSGSSESGNKSQ